MKVLQKTTKNSIAFKDEEGGEINKDRAHPQKRNLDIYSREKTHGLILLRP